MAGFDDEFETFLVACDALDNHIPIRIELDNGNVYPHEDVIDVDINGLNAFWVKLSADGAKNHPDKYEAGDIAYFGVEDVKVVLLTDGQEGHH